MKNILKYFLIISILSLQVSISIAQPFSLDTTFQTDYIFRDFYFEEQVGGIGNIFEMEDGSIGLGGSFRDHSIPYVWGDALILNHNGERNPNFKWHASGESGVSFIYNKPYLYLGGLLRFNSETFERDSVFDHNRIESNWEGWPLDTYFLKNGDYYICGGLAYHLQLPDERRSYFCRIKENGYYDTSFHHDANFPVKHFFRYDSTRIILTGNFSAYDGVPMNRIARIYNDGTLDTTFHSIFTFTILG